jgi:hypothetical protein
MPSPGIVGNPNWVPGHSQGGGRKAGSRNRRTAEILERLRARGDKDPVDFLSEVVTNADNQHDADIRVQASALLAPYMHSKTGATHGWRAILHTQKVEIKSEKPLLYAWQKKDFPFWPNGVTTSEVPIDHLTVRILPPQPTSPAPGDSTLSNSRNARQ